MCREVSLWTSIPSRNRCVVDLRIIRQHSEEFLTLSEGMAMLLSYPSLILIWWIRVICYCPRSGQTRLASALPQRGCLLVWITLVRHGARAAAEAAKATRMLRGYATVRWDQSDQRCCNDPIRPFIIRVWTCSFEANFLDSWPIPIMFSLSIPRLIQVAK